MTTHDVETTSGGSPSVDVEGGNAAPRVSAYPERSRQAVVLGALSPRKIGAVYVWAAAIIAFSAYRPHIFPTMQTLQGVTSQYAITGLAAIAIIASLACGAFDLTIGANIGLAGMVFARNYTHPSTSIWVCLGLAMLVGLGIALANIITVVIFEIDSFIGTLAMTAVIDAVDTAVSGGQFVSISPHGSWGTFATGQWFSIQRPFYYLLIAAIVIGYWLERTKSGRYLYAVGFDRETARLTGVPVSRLRAAGYLVSGLLGAFTGIIYVTLVGSASPGGGDPFLIPAFSAAFLGATQIRPGRFNTWGTLVAVFLLGTGDFGITISGGPVWATRMFEGIVLLVAIALAQVGGQRIISRNQLRRLVGKFRRTPAKAEA